MPKKYTISTQITPPRFTPIGKSGVVDFSEDCARCQACAKDACIYDVYTNRNFDSKQLADSIDYLCKNCYRCIQTCKKGLISKSINPEYLKMGDDYWTPDIISHNWYQAETGKIPVSGAGYRGKFVDKGFDEMWTDMSEIVRPTRDGIHGREYISSSIDLGRKLSMLEFDKEGDILSDIPHIIDIPLPIIFNLLPFGAISENVLLSLAKAAQELDTFMVIKKEEIKSPLTLYRNWLIPQIPVGSGKLPEEIIKNARVVELLYQDGFENILSSVKEINPEAIVSLKVPLNTKTAPIVENLVLKGVEIIHLQASVNGNAIKDGDNSGFTKELVREVHLNLVEKSLRDEVTLLASGGIAMAEHIAKIIICGADGVAIDLPLLIALECRLCKKCQKGLPCPVKVGEIEPEWAVQRIMNLVGAWRSQLLEVLGAMGMREVRRLRGEVGRAMFFQDLERENFAPLFGERKENS
jgi:ferredoxin